MFMFILSLIGNASFYELIGLILCFMGLFSVFGFKIQSTNIDPDAPVGKLYIVTCQTRTALVKVCLRNLIVCFLLCQLGIFGPCLVAALWTGGLLETPPPWHATIYINVFQVNGWHERRHHLDAEFSSTVTKESKKVKQDEIRDRVNALGVDKRTTEEVVKKYGEIKKNGTLIAI